jgi:hypothetical protein
VRRGDSAGASGRRLAAVPAAAALDDLVSTVDELVRDLDPEPAQAVAALPARAPAEPHGRAFTVAVVVGLILFELVVLTWLLSNL